jgi:hypothetical protein
MASRPKPRRLGREEQIARAKSQLLGHAAQVVLPYPTGPPTILADDLLVGAEQISRFMFGTASKRRQVYWLANSGEIPVFRLGAMMCARKSTLLQHITNRENSAA